MKTLTLLVSLAAVQAFAHGEAFAQLQETIPPVQSTTAEPSFREKYRADRDKFDRELKLDTARPWDGKDWGQRRITTPAAPEPTK